MSEFHHGHEPRAEEIALHQKYLTLEGQIDAARLEGDEREVRRLTPLVKRAKTRWIKANRGVTRGSLSGGLFAGRSRPRELPAGRGAGAGGGRGELRAAAGPTRNYRRRVSRASVSGGGPPRWGPPHADSVLAGARGQPVAVIRGLFALRSTGLPLSVP